jgi:hypothetical protein
MEDEKFRQELDELFMLFKKMLEREDVNEIPGVNNLMFQQLQVFFSNYENMKGDIARQLQNQFGDSIKDMVHQMVLQLREELGEDQLFKEDTSVSIDIKPAKPKVEELTIEQLDEMLKDPNLSEEEVNELLDKRHRLSDI